MEEYYFGYTDASTDEIVDLINTFTDTSIEDKIKSGNKKKGKQVVVGIKGSGKTCLRRKYESFSDTVVFNLDSDNAYLQIDAIDFTEHSGRLKNIISFEILRAFSEISIQKLNQDDNLKTKLSTAYDKAKNIINKIPNAINVKTGIGTINLRELFKAEASPVVQNAWNQLLSDILESLDNTKAYILIDDAEDVFKGLEMNPDFIEALSRSVLDINKKSKDKLHILLFIKNGIWRIWFEKQREYDKVKHIIEHITWKKDKLIELIARRIANIHDIEFKEDQVFDLWKKEFEFEKLEEIADFILKYCVNGPRDLIELCNLSKKEAGDKKIDINHVKSILNEFSESKVFSISADYGDVYPDIHLFIKKIFQGLESKYKGTELESILETKGLLDEKTEASFQDYLWYSTSSKEQLLLLMFKVGLIGVNIDDEIIYSIQNPNENINDLEENKVVIHPAFRPHLGIKN